MENIEHHFNKICRVCKSISSVMQYIFVNNGSTDDCPRIDEMLMACSAVVVNYGDGLPNLICSSCNEKLTNAYQFKQLCERTDSTLRQYLKDAENCTYKEFTSNENDSVIINEGTKENEDVSYVNEEKDYKEIEVEIKLDLDDNDQEFSCGSKTDFIEFVDNNELFLISHACPKCAMEQCKCDQIHICDICNKGFNEQDSLTIHKKLHINEMPDLENLHDMGEDIDIEYCVLNGNDMIPMFSNIETEPNNLHVSEKEVFDFESSGLEKPINIEDIASIDTEELKEKNKTKEKMLQNPKKQQTVVTERLQDSSCRSSKRSPKKCLSKSRKRRPTSNKVRSKRATETDNGIASADAIKNRKFTCIICNKKVGRRDHLTRHMLCHSEEKLFGCEFCDKRYNRTDTLRNHMKMHSLDYECRICKEPFGNLSTLENHLTFKHNIRENINSNINYRCSECFESFISEKSRNAHMIHHLYNKNLQCHICKKSFISRENLTEHVKLHSEHSIKLKCSECEQRFIRAQDLITHMQQHRTIHPCTICNKKFGRNSNLKAHMKTHNVEKPYRCKYCQAAFTQENYLNSHIQQRHNKKRITSK
ncbi:hypothetical protein RN001_007691 [Aquatica leii]|uniref:Zinc finger protein n=1 Tax=Aquatica leii TaxID=1421715 RepID=A0AAN7Q4I4_9COLE|nr:hypothetical protein RN001_007691 [Aquatica leii]